MEGIDWRAVWEFLWPILKEGLIALLMALLALLGYDKFVPSRYVRDMALRTEQGKNGGAKRG